MLDFDSSSAEYIIDKRQPINISFENTGEYTSKCVNLPIILDGACIGVITKKLRIQKKFDKRRRERHYSTYKKKLKNGTYARQDWFKRNNVFLFDGISKIIDKMIPTMIDQTFSNFIEIRNFKMF